MRQRSASSGAAFSPARTAVVDPDVVLPSEELVGEAHGTGGDDTGHAGRQLLVEDPLVLPGRHPLEGHAPDESQCRPAVADRLLAVGAVGLPGQRLEAGPVRVDVHDLVAVGVGVGQVIGPDGAAQAREVSVERLAGDLGQRSVGRAQRQLDLVRAHSGCPSWSTRKHKSSSRTRRSGSTTQPWTSTGPRTRMDGSAMSASGVVAEATGWFRLRVVRQGRQRRPSVRRWLLLVAVGSAVGGGRRTRADTPALHSTTAAGRDDQKQHGEPDREAARPRRRQGAAGGRGGRAHGRRHWCTDPGWCALRRRRRDGREGHGQARVVRQCAGACSLLRR